MPTPFQKLVMKIKRKYKWKQRDIAYALDVSENTISRCFNGHQRNTGALYVPDLEWLIVRLEEEKGRGKKTKKHTANTNQYSGKPDSSIAQSNISDSVEPQEVGLPLYRYGTTFTCHSCKEHQIATTERACSYCQSVYHLG